MPPGRAAGDPGPAIETARPSDLPALIELDRVCFGRQAWPPAAWLETVTEPTWTSLLVRADGAPVAAAVLLPFAPVAHLASIGVHPEFRDRGLGTALLRDVLRRAHAAGARFVALEVDVTNQAARRLYRREGFGLLRRFREDGRWRVEMQRRLGGHDGS